MKANFGSVGNEMDNPRASGTLILMMRCSWVAETLWVRISVRRNREGASAWQIAKE